MNFYEGRPFRPPFLGLQEGETRKKCPPGTVLANLPDFPWSECIPESEAFGREGVPAELAPAPAPPPVVPALPAPPRKARFLDVDPATGNVLDPATGAVVETASVYLVEPTDVVAVGAGLGILAVLLALTGAFK